MSDLNNWYNGSYDICYDCAAKWGTIRDGSRGVWMGECAICGEHKPLGNAKHDFDMADDEVEDLMWDH